MATSTYEDPDPSSIVHAAIQNTPKDYWEMICASRADKDPRCSGSYFRCFDKTVVDKFMRRVSWEPYTHEAVKAPARAFIARYTTNGIIGVGYAQGCDPSIEITFDDSKNTGYVEAIVEANDELFDKNGFEVDFTVMIVGPDGDGRERVYTFHPGDPIEPSRLKRHVVIYDDTSMRAVPHDRHGRKMRLGLAMELGVKWVKIRRQDQHT